ncbi:hypothetical protein TNCV_2564481 [Trichonephila clavipes]|nr:hypothetical protein TNCV_2564481 [Trichonephila clavipes]
MQDCDDQQPSEKDIVHPEDISNAPTEKCLENVDTKYSAGDAMTKAVEELQKSQESSTSVFNNWMQSSSPKEELLGLLPLKGQTRGEDIANTVIVYMDKHPIPLDKIVSISTDGVKSFILEGRTTQHILDAGSVTAQRYKDQVLEPHVRLFLGAIVVVETNATCLTLSDRGPRNSSRPRTKTLRLSLALVLSTMQVTVRFCSVSSQFRGRKTWGCTGASHLSSPSTNLTRGLAARDCYLEYPHATKALYIYKHPCLLRDSNPVPTALSVANHYTGWTTGVIVQDFIFMDDDARPHSANLIEQRKREFEKQVRGYFPDGMASKIPRPKSYQACLGCYRAITRHHYPPNTNQTLKICAYRKVGTR